MWAAISACGQDAASPETATRNSASPRLATSTCVLCWSSAPTMYSDRVEETPRYDSGACIWPRAEASSPTIGPSSLLLASLLFCIVAVARKLAVLLHRIWVTQEPYIPFY